MKYTRIPEKWEIVYPFTFLRLADKGPSHSSRVVLLYRKWGEGVRIWKQERAEKVAVIWSSQSRGTFSEVNSSQKEQLFHEFDCLNGCGILWVRPKLRVHNSRVLKARTFLRLKSKLKGIRLEWKAITTLLSGKN